VESESDAIAELEAFRDLPHYGDAVLVLRHAQRQGESITPVLKRIKRAFYEYQEGANYAK
jgi:hypothetical protein